MATATERCLSTAVALAPYAAWTWADQGHPGVGAAMLAGGAVSAAGLWLTLAGDDPRGEHPSDDVPT